MGRTFYEYTLPELVKAINRLGKNMDRLAEVLEKIAETIKSLPFSVWGDNLPICAGCNGELPKEQLVRYKNELWCQGCYEDMGKSEGGHVFTMPIRFCPNCDTKLKKATPKDMCYSIADYFCPICENMLINTKGQVISDEELKA